MAISKVLDENTSDEISINAEAFSIVSAKEIQKMIAQLPPGTAVVFNMYVYEGYTHKQIGETLGISDGTSKWHLSEAKRILKSKMESFTSTSTNANAAG